MRENLPMRISKGSYRSFPCLQWVHSYLSRPYVHASHDIPSTGAVAGLLLVAIWPRKGLLVCMHYPLQCSGDYIDRARPAQFEY